MTDSPYQLPDGPVAIQFSGGRTSGYMLHQILDHYDGKLPVDCHVMFQNTGREMPQTLDFVQRCSEVWGQRVVWLEYDEEVKFREVSHNSASRNGEPFAAFIRKRGHLPSRVARFCTAELKIRPLKAWLMSQGYERWNAAIGIRADEKHRAKPTTEARTVVFWPLLKAGKTKRNVAEFWRAQPFDLELPNINGKTPLGNCDGCMLKSEKSRAFLAKYFPDRAQWWADMESETGETFSNPDPARKEATWQQLIDHAKKQADWVFDDEAGIYCDVGFGGCHD